MGSDQLPPNNLNELASLIAQDEGKKKELSIAQIKEVVRVLRELIREYPLETLRLLIKK